MAVEGRARDAERPGDAAHALAAVGLFLGALAFGALSLEPSEGGSAFVTMLLKAFFVLVVGGIALGCVALAIQAWVAPARAALRPRRLPEALGRFCPACGEASSPDELSCARCAHPFLRRAARWRGQEKRACSARRSPLP